MALLLRDGRGAIRRPLNPCQNYCSPMRVLTHSRLKVTKPCGWLRWEACSSFMTSLSLYFSRIQSPTCSSLPVFLTGYDSFKPSQSSAPAISLALAGFATGVVAVVPYVMVLAFPAPVRFSGISFAYNIGYAVFGGLTPIFVSWLLPLDRLAPAHYVAALSLVGCGLGLFLFWFPCRFPAESA